MSSLPVLMIEDDGPLAEMVAEYLAGHGLEVTVRGNAESGLGELATGGYQALILDLMLPDVDGFEVCRRVRASSNVPIVMLTARGETTDRIVGLELGADDYLSKPFDPRELLARLRAVLRRGRSTGMGHIETAGRRDAGELLRFGLLEIDHGAREVRLDGEPRSITSFQFDLLWALAGNAGRVMTRDALMNAVRGIDHSAFDRSIDVHVSRIRAAIEADSRHPRRLLTVRGVGYVFAREAAERS